MELRPAEHRTSRNEVHIINTLNGHILDMDCWCEPHGYWHTNKNNILMFVVEHKDGQDGRLQHMTVLSARTSNPDALTTLLNSIYTFEHER